MIYLGSQVEKNSRISFKKQKLGKIEEYPTSIFLNKAETKVYNRRSVFGGLKRQI